MEHFHIDYQPYAELLINVGLNLRLGQKLFIRSPYEGYPLARLCAQYAYAQGAALVEIGLSDKNLIRARVAAQSSHQENLSLVPGWTDAWQKTLVQEKWACLSLDSCEELDVLKDLDQSVLTQFTRVQGQAKRYFKDAVTAYSIPWCVAALPGPHWAERVLGKGKTTLDLWQVLLPILRLDYDNPSKAWKELGEQLILRSQTLDAMELDSLHFIDEGTDLIIGLNPTSRWSGGPEIFDGRANFPNIPTEETYTSPDRCRSQGRARVTRPVEVRGSMVEGLELIFDQGILCDFKATKGGEFFAAFLDTDPGARRLGEVALVDSGSPIARSGLNFSSILYDENAACHIALGSAYSSCLENGSRLDTDKKKEKAGCNVSLVHLDFMIGSPRTMVKGISRNGKEITIINKGKFVI